MQQILHNTNKTDTFQQNLKPKTQSSTKTSYKGQSVKMPSLSELKDEVKKLTFSAYEKQTIVEDLLKNGNDAIPVTQEMSVYESLIERVTTNEKSLMMIIRAFRDISRIAESLDLQLSKLIQFILSQQKTTSKKITQLNNGLKRTKEEIEELKAIQNELEYISNKQKYMIGALFGLLIVLLLICIMSYYYYNKLFKNKKVKKEVLLCSYYYGKSRSKNFINR